MAMQVQKENMEQKSQVLTFVPLYTAFAVRMDEIRKKNQTIRLDCTVYVNSDNKFFSSSKSCRHTHKPAVISKNDVTR